MKEKRCTKCDEVKSGSEFHKRKASNDGLKPICKKCSSVQGKLQHLRLLSTILGVCHACYYTQTHPHHAWRRIYTPTYTEKELLAWMLINNVVKLHKNYMEADQDFKLLPTCDRTDPNLPYTFDNMTMMTARENTLKAAADTKRGIDNRKNKPVKQIKNGVVIATYHSQQEAFRKTGIRNAYISLCCIGKRKSAGGYQWCDA